MRTLRCADGHTRDTTDPQSSSLDAPHPANKPSPNAPSTFAVPHARSAPSSFSVAWRFFFSALFSSVQIRSSVPTWTTLTPRARDLASPSSHARW